MISALRNPGLSGSVLVGLTFCAASAMAEQYAWQLDGGVHRADTAGSAEIDTTFVTATGYFPPIDDSDGPLALAPFLSRSSRVSATVAGIEEDYLVTASGPIGGQPIVSTGGNDSRMYSASGRYVWRNSGWYAGGGLRSFSIDHPVSGSLDIDNDRDGYALSAGKYLAPSTALELEFGSTTSETSILAPLCTPQAPCLFPLFLGTTKIESENLGLSVLHAGEVGAMSYAVSGEFSTSDTTIRLTPAPAALPTGPFSPNPGIPVYASPNADIGQYGPVAVLEASEVSPPDVDNYQIAGELFPTSRLGVKLGIAMSDAGNVDLERTELSVTWFFKRAIAVEFSIAQTEADYSAGGSIDDDESAIRLIGRLH